MFLHEMEHFPNREYIMVAPGVNTVAVLLNIGFIFRLELAIV